MSKNKHCLNFHMYKHMLGCAHCAAGLQKPNSVEEEKRATNRKLDNEELEGGASDSAKMPKPPHEQLSNFGLPLDLQITSLLSGGCP